MTLDASVRSRLQKTVTACRRLLTEDFDHQLQRDLGIYAGEGRVLPLDKLSSQDEGTLRTAGILRERIEHLAAAEKEARDAFAKAVQRILREQAFTLLNRFAALRMAEERGIIQPAVRDGYKSDAFVLFEQFTGAALGDQDARYRTFIRCLWDELSLDLGILFDRHSTLGLLFPAPDTLQTLFRELNAPDIRPLWKEDETIGWIYQYYNDADERKKMREESAAPRNSRELAVRNQFFTPRYVVEFLTDNTLGRIWFEMTRGETKLKEQCRYLVRRPTEIFLKPSEAPPTDNQEPGTRNQELSQEELLRQPVHIPHRPLKDPREIRLLDPACGSMHFGLYAFDLLEVLYNEAWEFAKSGSVPPGADESFSSFILYTSSFPSKETFLRQVPRLIVEHNLHGIDIDPRAAQIAGLSLWLRAQRAWHQAGVKPADRPRITRSNLVCAESMPGEKELLREFVESAFPADERPAFAFLLEKIFDRMTLASEAGSLLRIEEEVLAAIAEAKRLWKEGPNHEQATLFPKATAQKGQGEMRLDLSGITDEQFWERAEQRIYDALEAYAEQAENGGGFQRRLFADDAAQGFAFIDLCRKRYDVVVMNPPFGEPSKGSKSYLEIAFPNAHNDLLATFIERFAGVLTPESLLGAITSRTAFFLSSFETWRENVLLRIAPPTVVADLGQGVLDAAMVETAAYCLRRSARQETIFVRLVRSQEKSAELMAAIAGLRDGATTGLPLFTVHPSSFEMIPGAPFSYWVSELVRGLFCRFPSFEDEEACVRVTNPTADEFRFLRNFWEVSPNEVGRALGWVPYAKGGSSRQFYYDVNLLAMWDDKTPTYKGYVGTPHRPDIRPASLEFFFRAGVMWPLRAPRLCAQAFPEGTVFSARSQCLFAPRHALGYYLGLLNSSILDYLFKAALGRTDFPEFIIGILRKLPKAKASEALRISLASASTRAASIAQRDGSFDEIGHLFAAPEFALLKNLQSLGEGSKLITARRSASDASLAATQQEINALSFEVYQLPADERRVIAESQLETRGQSVGTDEIDDENQVGSDASSQTFALVSWIFGTVFGRWDIRYATGERSAPELPDPFAPLPVCPPGMLQGDDGLPLSKEKGERMKDEGKYPLRVSWGGVLVDDENHLEDVVGRMREALALIWKDNADTLEHEACALLGVPTLREWFRRPAAFFADHLKRYSKSRRLAPIYWPLSTPSGSYTLWIYYNRLTDQTLFQCVTDFIDPKLKALEQELARLRKAPESKATREALEAADTLRIELEDMKGELLRVAALPWKPNLNDGVLITASPLWKLFRLPKWQKDLKSCWQELERGDYDWAHLAYTISPDRVKKACEKDRSIAIAHGLEHLCKVEPPKPKAKRGKKKESEAEDEA